jgi:hypothetical protein
MEDHQEGRDKGARAHRRSQVISGIPRPSRLGCDQTPMSRVALLMSAFVLP